MNYQLVGADLRPGQAPVAMIHGLGANLAFWYLGAVRHLAADLPILLHDLRGHGASSMPPSHYRLHDLAADFAALLDHLQIDRAHVVGHSHGARVALAFAIAHPDRVASLTVADTQLRALQRPMRLADWPHWPRWKAELAGQGVTSFPPEDAEIDFRLLADLGPRGGAALAGARGAMRAVNDEAGPEDPPELSLLPGAGGGRLAAALARPGAGALAARMPRLAALAAERAAPDAPRRIDLRSRQMGARGSQKWQTLLETTTAATELQDEGDVPADRLPGLTMPVLLIYGALSHCVPSSERLLEVIPDARRIMVPNAGHFFPIVKPRLFARALRMFVAGVETAGTPARGRFRERVQAARAARMRPQ
ncbi:alpha/beta fold hydrolase [Frigidibacter sp.]|uniref:alpha/beta fold hydrolase n=1 Tax=Frigidibacter sp. TaxID=2586418 RepID=UPI0027324CD1|nr:alpha/beta fold hydrolase [Frigidibacter sp.]MDP3340268.1 alpha/beta fold hydrolase [Frigidibacter sp.]